MSAVDGRSRTDGRAAGGSGIAPKGDREAAVGVTILSDRSAAKGRQNGGTLPSLTRRLYAHQIGTTVSQAPPPPPGRLQMIAETFCATSASVAWSRFISDKDVPLGTYRVIRNSRDCDIVCRCSWVRFLSASPSSTARSARAARLCCNPRICAASWPEWRSNAFR